MCPFLAASRPRDYDSHVHCHSQRKCASHISLRYPLGCLIQHNADSAKVCGSKSWDAFGLSKASLVDTPHGVNICCQPMSLQTQDKAAS